MVVEKLFYGVSQLALEVWWTRLQSSPKKTRFAVEEEDEQVAKIGTRK